MVLKFDLSYLTKRRAAEVQSMFNHIKTSVQQVQDVPVKKSRQKAFIEIKKYANLSALNSDIISIKQGDKKYSLISETPHKLRIVEMGLKSKHIENDLLINAGNLASANVVHPKNKNLDTYINSVFELFDSTFLTLRKAFSNPKFIEYLNLFKIPKSLNDYNQKRVDNIISLFNRVDKKIISVQNPQTRSSIKNGYPNINKGILGSKRLEFKDVNGKCYSVNILVDAKKQSNLVISVDENGQTKHIIVEPDGKVLKSKKINKRQNTGDTPIYYNEREIDSPFITNSLIELESELVNYDKYVSKRLSDLAAFRYKYSTEEIGTIKNAVMDKIFDMRNKRAQIHDAMKWLKNDERRNANEKLGIKLGKGKNNAIMIKRVGQYKETVHVSFPTIDNIPCTKILILNRNNEVEKTYFIKGSNLIKFDAKDTSLSKYSTTIDHYHSQDEIDKSSLNIYADEIQVRLNEISEIIKVKNWYK